jgi:putative transposase
MVRRLHVHYAEVSMPRAPRYAPPDSVHHVINRGNERRALFDGDIDYSRFLDLMARTKQRSPVRILAYCLMPNHWHMILWPEGPHSISRFLQRLSTAHSASLRRTTSTVGHGHVYQDRYHAFLVESEPYYYAVLRYVESNPLRAGLVARAADWRWSSLAERLGEERRLVEPGPLALPPNWLELVDTGLPEDILGDIRQKLRRHVPN